MPAINDFQIERNWVSRLIPAKDFHTHMAGLLDDVPPTVADVTVVDASVTDSGFNNALLEVSTLKHVGFLMNTAGDTVNVLLPLFPDRDVLFPMYARVLWTTGSQTVADTINWKIFDAAWTLNSTALSGTIDSPPTESQIPQDTVPTATAYTLNATSPAKWSALSAAVDLSGYMQTVQVEMDAKAAGLTEDIFFMGLEFLYVPHILGTKYGSGIVAPLPAGWS